MATQEEIRERRRQKVLEKLNAKYKDTPAEDDNTPILEKPTEKPAESAILGTQALTKQPESEPITKPKAKEEPQVSVFDEYRKMRNFEKFQETLFIIRTVLLIFFSIVSAFTVTGKSLFGVNLNPIYGFIFVQLSFVSLTYGLKKTKGSTYFDNKSLDIPLVKNLVGDKLMFLVDIGAKYVKLIMFGIERVEDLSFFVVLTILFSEILNFISMPK